MRVCVSGGRDYTDRRTLFAFLDFFHTTRKPITLLIEGEQRGADLLAREWAEQRGVPVAPLAADWSRYGKSAGNIRNVRMLEEFAPHVVICFPTGGPGTRNMMRNARRRGFPVIDVLNDKIPGWQLPQPE